MGKQLTDEVPLRFNMETKMEEIKLPSSDATVQHFPYEVRKLVYQVWHRNNPRFFIAIEALVVNSGMTLVPMGKEDIEYLYSIGQITEEEMEELKEMCRGE